MFYSAFKKWSEAVWLLKYLYHSFSPGINGELMGHLSDRDDLTELQDELLQKIFTLKK